MSLNFSKPLSRALIDIEFLKQDAFSTSDITARLCACKQDLLTAYFVSITNFLISLNALFQDLPYIANSRIVAKRLNYIRHTFDANCYENNTSNLCLSTKMKRLFELIQNPLDNEVFKTCYDVMVQFIGEEDNEEKLENYNLLQEKICTWAETVIFNMAGLRLNCSHIQNSILADEMTEEEIKNLRSCVDSENSIYCAGCLYPIIKNDNFHEELHIYVIEEFFQENDYMLPELLKLIHKYHSKPKEITLILDYKFLPPTKWEEWNYQILTLGVDLFKTVKIKNYDNLDLGQWSTRVCPFLSNAE